MASWIWFLDRGERGGQHAVLSLLVQARQTTVQRRQSPFEVLVRHLLDRLFRSESLGSSEEAPTRVAQLAYAVALPGLLAALFLFVPYHMPVARSMWWQVTDHYQYVAYSFVVMGLGTVLQWDLLFPDALDALILTPLPIAARRLLMARVIALSIFLGAILVGANLLGMIFLPGVADLRGLWLRHTLAHASAVLLCGLCTTTALVALQGLFLCLLGQRMARAVSPLVQVVCVLLLLTILFLAPLVPHFLQPVLLSGSAAGHWFPPFWFLGLYERLLWGNAAPQVFVGLARTALWATLLTTLLALVTYPIAYARRMRQVLEGTPIRGRDTRWLPQQLRGLGHRTLVRAPVQRAIHHLIGQTLGRTQRLRLLLAVFGGLGLAMTVAEVLLVHFGHGTIHFEMSPMGMRFAVPVMAFWTVAGLRTAFRNPVSAPGSWAFRGIHGRAKQAHLRAAERWVALCACAVTLATVAVLHVLAPAALPGHLALLVQVLVAVGLSVLLTDLFFLRELAIPFTEARPYSVNDLSFVMVTYFLLFPMMAIVVIEHEPWIEASAGHLACTMLGAVAAHLWLRAWRLRSIAEDARRLDLEEDVLIPGEMGLR